MKFVDHLKSLPPDQREELARQCGTSVGHLRNMSYGYRPCSPELAAAIERHTQGAVTRQELRPTDWHLIWPELAPAHA